MRLMQEEREAEETRKRRREGERKRREEEEKVNRSSKRSCSILHSVLDVRYALLVGDIQEDANILSCNSDKQ